MQRVSEYLSSLESGFENVVYDSNEAQKTCVCHYCGKKFRWASALSRHIRIHLTQKSHFCPVCPHSTYRKDHLDAHMKTHQKDKRFSCTKCKFKSYTQHELDNHICYGMDFFHI